MHWLTRHWYRRTWLSLALLPLSWLYCLAVVLRRALYRAGVLKTVALPVPVIVVGNLTVGGTGKTPLVAWLVQWLRERGHRPGIILRGYGARAWRGPAWAGAASDPAAVGDEAVVLARRTGCPVRVDPVRPRGARALVDEKGCDVIVSDDGLQHYALARDLEIAVIDGERRLGNGFCLPAGPLREPASRLDTVPIRVAHGRPRPGEHAMELRPVAFHRLDRPQVQAGAKGIGGPRVHGVAGIGNPARAFATLSALGLEVQEHPFPDHHVFRPADLDFGDTLPVIMTEKDAVKCEAFAGELPQAERYWYLEITAEADPALTDRIQALLEERRRG